MTLAQSACVLLVGSFALLSILAALQTSELANAWQKGPASGRQNRRLSLASQSATSSVQMVAQRLGATFRFGGVSERQLGDSEDEGNSEDEGDSEVEGEDEVEDDITVVLKEAEVRAAQWRLQSAEGHLKTALKGAEGWLNDLAKASIPLQQRERAFRKAIEVFTRLGSFLVARGRPEEAAEHLRRAEELAVSLAPPSSHARWDRRARRTTTTATLASPEDILARARAHAALGRALCTGAGKGGEAFLAAKRSFNAAIAAVAEAQAAFRAKWKREFLLSPLAAEVRLDLAECLHGEGGLAAARSIVDDASRILDSDVTGSMGPHLRQRLAMVRGGVAHDEGKFDEALRLYNEYLQLAGSSLSSLPHPTVAAELFGAMQDVVLVTSSKGLIQEALVSLDDILRLQQAADAELQAKSQRRTDKFLADDIIDPKLWAAKARTHIVHAEVLLEEGRAANKRPSLTALNEAQAAVTMLRRTGRLSTADLENALNTLGNVLISGGKQKSAEAAYRESLNLAEQRHGTSSPIVAALYHNLGAVLELRGELELAMKLDQRALDIQMKTIGFDNPDTAGSFTAIADIFEKQGKLGEAAEAAARAAESTRISYPEGHWQRTDADERAAKYTAAGRPTSKVVAAVVEAF